jgi:hypothetical protein
MQTLQTDYFAAYRHLKLSRDAKGVLVAEFHSDGGPFIMKRKLTRSLSMPFTESDKTGRTRLSS